MNGEGRPREDLLRQAQSLGIEHPENMTRVELARAIAQLEAGPAPKAPNSRAGSWLDIARQLLAAVVEQGLNMPDAAALIRGETKLSEPPKPQPPLATVTLAKIYAAQGHVTRALTVLADVLRAEPDHRAALELQTQIKNTPSSDATRRKAPSTPMPVMSVALATPTQPVEAVEAGGESRGGEQDALVLQLRDGIPRGVGWELARATEALRASGASVEIEWVTFAPSWRGPIRQLVRVPVTHAVGKIPVPKAAPPTLIHAVLRLCNGAKPLVLATLKKREITQLAPAISR